MQEVNVQVAVRVRPILPKEKLAGDLSCMEVLKNTNQLIVGKDRAFTFDHVFNTKSTQEELYTTCVDPLVRSIFDGYNATVFAYGQTGSGKTYTIGGCNSSSLTEEEYGVIPRAMHQMFQIMEANETIDYAIKVSYVEIYKEELQDLLDVETPSREMHVREDEQGNTVIIGAKEILCDSLDDVMSLLESGSAARHTGSTQMNEHSSRSHSVFSMLISQSWTEDDVLASKRSMPSSCDMSEDNSTMSHTMAGKFHFVDLAGSERAHRTGNVGDRFKESIYINTGLLSLGNVISALGDPKKKSSHIPYRESKITRLLKDSLGGNARTLMICCISPATANFDESLNALKYANRAKNIKNQPIVNRDIQSIRWEEMQCEIKSLREELVRQQTSVMSRKSSTCQVSDFEEKIIKLQTECAHYRMVGEEAYKQLMEIKERDILSQSQDVRLKDWLQLMEELKNKVPATLSLDRLDNQTIKDLQSELKQCRDDLRSDEDIFAEKSHEVNRLSDRILSLESDAADGDDMLSSVMEECRRHTQQMLEQQLRIEELQLSLKEMLVGESIDECGTTSHTSRPKSVPVSVYNDHFSSNLRPPSRNIKTSPALFSLDRVMQSFRARSQLLVSRLEDSDEVLHRTFSDENLTGSQEGTFVRKGTFRVKKSDKTSPGDIKSINWLNENSSAEVYNDGGAEVYGNGSAQVYNDGSAEVCKDGSAEMQKKKVKQSQLKVMDANHKMRDLAINIRMKEQLIRELVKSEKDAGLMNKQYVHKIQALEKEKLCVKKDLVTTQKALHELGQQETVEKLKLQGDYKKKIDEAKIKMAGLQKKQKETEKIANFASQHEKKIEDLKLAVDRMKQQHSNVQKKLKEETEQKAKLEREMQKEVQRVKELEVKSSQQTKILKRKNEEIAAVQRRLRSGSLAPVEQREKMEEQKKWVDNEIEKVLALRRQTEDLNLELQRREAIVCKKEGILAERSELEIKKLRSSNILSNDVVAVSSKLQHVEKQIEDKRRELFLSTEDEKEMVNDDITKLKKSRDKLQKNRLIVEEKLNDGQILSPKDERRLIELDEAIEALDAAIEYRNDSIHNRQAEIRRSQILVQSEDSLINRLKSLTNSEMKALLTKYFDKVISLREEERKISFHTNELEIKIDEQERVIGELENTLQRNNIDSDRRLLLLQSDYEQKMQLLMHQLTEGGSGNSTILQLEKDVYYYKKTSRDLKKKIKELISKGVLSSQVFEEVSMHSSLRSIDDVSATPRGHLPTTPREVNMTPRGHHDVNASRDSHRSSQPSGITPVKISRRDLRPMSEEEVLMRRSGVKVTSPQPQDSLNSPNNPWS